MKTILPFCFLLGASASVALADPAAEETLEIVKLTESQLDAVTAGASKSVSVAVKASGNSARAVSHAKVSDNGNVTGSWHAVGQDVDAKIKIAKLRHELKKIEIHRLKSLDRLKAEIRKEMKFIKLRVFGH